MTSAGSKAMGTTIPAAMVLTLIKTGIQVGSLETCDTYFFSSAEFCTSVGKSPNLGK